MSNTANQDSLGRKGIGIALIQAEYLDKIRVKADFVKKFKAGEKTRLSFDGFRLPKSLSNLTFSSDTLVVAQHNAYVNTGLNNALDLEWGLNSGSTHTIGWIGVDHDSSTVTASTVYLHGASGGSSTATTVIKALSPAATRTNQTTTGGATFANADFTNSVFIINKLGLLGTSTDAGTILVDVIGGTGGSSPYNRTFSLDLTSAGTFSLIVQIAVTATAV